MPKIQKNMYFPEKQWEHLRKLAEQENLPLAEIVRRAVDAYLAWRDPDYPATQAAKQGRPGEAPVFQPGASPGRFL